MIRVKRTFLITAFGLTLAASAPAQAANFVDVLQGADAAIRAGQAEAGALAAVRAYALAPDSEARYRAARLAAAGYFRAGRYSKAEWWLRRALQNATTDAERAALRQEMETVRAADPLSVKLGFSVAPSSNVNNGSSSQTVTIWNLPFVLNPDARALSGIEYSASADLTYRLAGSASAATFAGLSLYGRTYTLSRAAQKAAPNVRGSDYAFAQVEASLTHRRKAGPEGGIASFSLTGGENWYGQAPYARYQRAVATYEIGFGGGSAVQVSAGYERQQDAASGAISHAQTAGLSAGLPLAGGDRLAGSLAASRTRSADDPALPNTALRATVQYSLAGPVFGAQLGLSLAWEKRDYPFSVYGANGRHDRTLSAGVSAVLGNISYLGFSPTLSLEWSRTQSSIDLFDRKSLSVRSGIQSTF